MSAENQAQNTSSILYNRGGYLSEFTTLNIQKAAKFLRISDMRRDIVVVDSSDHPNIEHTRVGNDILAMKALETPHLPAILFKPRKYAAVTQEKLQFEVALKVAQMDVDIRNKGFSNREDYDRQFLRKLNSSLRIGLFDCLTQEKLGFHDQIDNYLVYMGLYVLPLLQNVAAITQGNEPPIGLQKAIIHFFVLNILVNGLRGSQSMFYSRSSGAVIDKRINPQMRFDWREGLLPFLPVDRFARGSFYLAVNGNDLIVPKEQT